MLISSVVSLQVWSDDIYALPERIHCTSPDSICSKWLPCLAGLLVTLPVFFIIYKKYKKKSKLCQKLKQENQQLRERIPPVKVLLLCSWDHKYFQYVIEKFAHFLEEDCRCDVTLELWERTKIAEVGTMTWLAKQLAAAEKVVVVWSRGAEFKWRTRSSKDNTPPFVEFEFGDLFTPGIVNVTDKYLKAPNKKYFFVYFDKISKDVSVPDVFKKEHVYNLMASLDQLLQNISCSPVSYQKTEAGQELSMAIQEFADYQKASPTWFEDWHGIEDDGHLNPNAKRSPPLLNNKRDLQITVDRSYTSSFRHSIRTTERNGLTISVFRVLQPTFLRNQIFVARKSTKLSIK
nr:PREDICTED: interleukin-17 receptor A-like [Latimeria chalumnae]|eukprot:XP_014340084.1 PREDICTED: interleukin-17 receptor A-like [Latimeria chalumnae]